MAGRYPFWHRRAGAVDAPPGLRDLGKKLLEQLANRQRLGAPPTLTLRESTPEGSVTARMVFGRPQVFFTVPQPGAQPEEPIAGGFVVWPSEQDGVTPLDPEPAVYLECVPGRYNRYYFDAELADSASPARSYAPGFPGLPDRSLQLSGNVDWRDTKERHSVSWNGARSRYWANRPNTALDAFIDMEAEIFGGRAYRNGQPVFDWDVVGDVVHPKIATGDLAWLVQSEAVVVGAAIGKAGILVVIRAAGVQFSTSDTVYVLLLVPLASYRPELRSVELPDPDDIEVLAVMHIENGSAGNFGFGHSWMFNSAATEARCMHHGMNELVLAFDPDAETWEFSTTAQPIPSNAVGFSQVMAYQHRGYTMPAVPQIFVGSGSFDRIIVNADQHRRAGFHADGSVSLGSGRNNVFPLDDTKVNATSPSGDPWVACAVDYRGDTPVYAYQRIPSSSLTTQRVNNIAAPADSYSVLADTRTDHLDGGGNVLYWDGDVHITHLMTEAVASTEARTWSGYTGGLKFDDQEFLGAIAGSEEVSRDFSHSFNHETQVLFQEGPSAPLKYVDQTQNEVRTRTVEYTSSKDLVNSYVAPLYLDLRNGFVCIAEVAARDQDAYSLNSTVVFDFTNEFYLDGGGTTSDTTTIHSGTANPSVPLTRVRTKTTTLTIRTMLEGELLSESVSELQEDGSENTSVSFNDSLFAQAGVVFFDTEFVNGPPPLEPANINSLSTPDYAALWGTTFNLNVSTGSSATFTNTSPTVFDGDGTQPRWPISFDSFIGAQPTHPLNWMREKQNADDKVCYGSWQTYKNRYAFSHVAPVTDASQPEFAFGLRHVPMPDAVGVVSGAVLYHPIWVLTPFIKKG